MRSTPSTTAGTASSLRPRLVLLSLPYLDWRYAGVPHRNHAARRRFSIVAMRILWPQSLRVEAPTPARSIRLDNASYLRATHGWSAKRSPYRRAPHPRNSGRHPHLRHARARAALSVSAPALTAATLETDVRHLHHLHPPLHPVPHHARVGHTSDASAPSRVSLGSNYRLIASVRYAPSSIKNPTVPHRPGNTPTQSCRNSPRTPFAAAQREPRRADAAAHGTQPMSVLVRTADIGSRHFSVTPYHRRCTTLISKIVGHCFPVTKSRSCCAS